MVRPAALYVCVCGIEFGIKYSDSSEINTTGITKFYTNLNSTEADAKCRKELCVAARKTIMAIIIKKDIMLLKRLLYECFFFNQINDYLLANPAIAGQINSVSIVGDFL